jgi:alpha-glucosidase
MTWLPAPAGVLAFARGGSVWCFLNLSPEPVRLPAHGGLLLASGPTDGDVLPPDCAAWLRAAVI